MRLHPVTWLMLWAVALQMAAAGIMLAVLIIRLPQLHSGDSFGLRMAGAVAQLVVLPLSALGSAIFVEITFRVWQQLQRGRVEQRALA